MTKMATVTIYGEKPLKIRLLLQYHMADCSETWYIDFLDPGGGGGGGGGEESSST